MLWRRTLARYGFGLSLPSVKVFFSILFRGERRTRSLFRNGEVQRCPGMEVEPIYPAPGVQGLEARRLKIPITLPRTPRPLTSSCLDTVVFLFHLEFTVHTTCNRFINKT